MVSLPEQRFAILHANMDVGGAEKQSVILGSLLRSQGATVKLFGFEGPGPLADLCDQSGLDWESLDIRWGSNRLQTATHLAKLARVLRRWRPTVLLPYCDIPNIFCGAIWQLTGARLCVWNQRGIDFYVQRSRLGQLVLRRSRCILSNSAYRAEYLEKRYGVLSSRVHVVPNAVIVPAQQPDPTAFRRAHGIGDERFVCVTVANFVERKNHGVLLDAWARLHEREVPRRPLLILVGRKESYFQTLVPRLQRLEQTGAEVIVLDYQHDVSEIVAASDLLLFSSNSEGLPNAVLEAMSLGKAVVAVNDPSVVEALGDSESVRRFLVPADDAEALASRIHWAMENPEVLAEAGRSNHLRAIREFSEEALLRRTVEAISPYLVM